MKTYSVSFTKEEKFLLFDLILDNFPEDKQLNRNLNVRTEWT